MALVLALMLMCSMSAFAADTSGRGDDYWDWDNGQSFGWNIASSFTALDNNRQGKPIPFQDKSVYDAVAAGVKVYLGQLPADKEITVANINAAVAAGELTEIQIGGFCGKGSTPSFNQNLTVKTVKEKGLIVVADKGLTFLLPAFAATMFMATTARRHPGAMQGTSTNPPNMAPQRFLTLLPQCSGKTVCSIRTAAMPG